MKILRYPSPKSPSSGRGLTFASLRIINVIVLNAVDLLVMLSSQPCVQHGAPAMKPLKHIR